MAQKREDGFAQARLADLKGFPHLAEEVKKLVDFLKEERGKRSAGILLYGPPGTGKTLTSRILATEAGAFWLDATSLPREGEWKGEDVKALFSKARALSRRGRLVLVHLEELQEIDERFDASVSLSCELDRIVQRKEKIFVVATTNDLFKCDQRLLRPGRLYPHLGYTFPSPQGRKEILEHYLSKKPHEPLDTASLAQLFPSYTSPAAIERLVEDSYLEALIRGGRKITERDLVKKLLKLVLGAPEKEWNSEQERKIACVHEAGHAVVAVELGVPVKIVAVPLRGYSRGITLTNLEDGIRSTKLMEDEITICYGGEIAEEFLCGERCLGRNDLDTGKATALAFRLEAEWGKERNYYDFHFCDPTFSRLEKIFFPLPQEKLSKIYEKVEAIMRACRKRALRILRTYGKRELKRMAGLIYEREFLLGEEVRKAVKGAGA